MTRTLLLAALCVLTGAAQAASFQLSVDAANDQGQIRPTFIYDQAGCTGQNVSPGIAWQHPPTGTRGFALTVYDPDAKGGWWHWIVADIPSITTHMDQGGVLPPGALALKNSFGHARWDGPCPPAGDAPHHYVFTLYALDTAALGLLPDTPPEQVKAAIESHALGQARVTYTYGR